MSATQIKAEAAGNPFAEPAGKPVGEPAGKKAGKKAARRGGAGEVGFLVGSQAVTWLWTLAVLLPLAWTVMSSFKTSREILQSPLALPSRWSFDNYVEAWGTAHIGDYYLNSVVVVVCALFLVMVLGAMCAYVLASFDFPGRGSLLNVMVGALSFPLFLAIVPLYRLLSAFSLLNTLQGLVLVYVVFALPFTVYFLHSFFKDLPRDLYEAAKIDGAGEWRTFFSVMLPLTAPGLGAVGMFNFVGLWNQYLLPLVLTTDKDKFVLTQGMQAFAQVQGRSINFGALFAAVVMTILPLLVIYVAFQRRIAGSVSQGSFR
jgi:N-acetylglucosamine transport system permease protein